MAYALVGSVGTVVQGTSGVSISTLAFGSGETPTTVNDLLICWVAGDGSATLPSTPSGWSIGKQEAGTSCSSSIFYKIAAGSDSAPTIAAVTSTVLSAQLAEFSGGVTSSPLDQSGGAAGTSSPVVANNTAKDTKVGNLVITGSALFYNMSETNSSGASTGNNGISFINTTNNGTSTASHYDFGYGTATGNSAADQNSYGGFTTTQITGVAVAIASFKVGIQSFNKTLAAPVATTSEHTFKYINKSISKFTSPTNSFLISAALRLKTIIAIVSTVITKCFKQTNKTLTAGLSLPYSFPSTSVLDTFADASAPRVLSVYSSKWSELSALTSSEIYTKVGGGAFLNGMGGGADYRTDISISPPCEIWAIFSATNHSTNWIRLTALVTNPTGTDGWIAIRATNSQIILEDTLGTSQIFNGWPINSGMGIGMSIDVNFNAQIYIYNGSSWGPLGGSLDPVQMGNVTIPGSLGIHMAAADPSTVISSFGGGSITSPTNTPTTLGTLFKPFSNLIFKTIDIIVNTTMVFNNYLGPLGSYVLGTIPTGSDILISSYGVLKTVLKNINPSVVTISTLNNKISKTISTIEPGLVTILKQINKFIKGTVVTIASVLRPKLRLQILIITSPTITKIIKSVGKFTTPISTTLALYNQQSGKHISTTEPGIVSINKSILKNIGIIISITHVFLTKQIGKILTAIDPTTGKLSKFIGKFISPVEGTLASFNKGSSKTISATEPGILSVNKGASKNINTIVSGSISTLQKMALKVLFTTVNTVVTLGQMIIHAGGTTYTQTIAFVQASIVSILKNIEAIKSTIDASSIIKTNVPQKGLDATVTTIGAPTKFINKTIKFTSITIASIIKSIGKSINTISSTVLTLPRFIGSEHMIQQGSTSSPGKFINKIITFIEPSIVTLSAVKAKFMTLIVTVITTTTLIKSILKNIITSDGTSVSLRKSIGKFIQLISTSLAYCNKFGNKTIFIVSSTSTSLFKLIFKSLIMISVTILFIPKYIGSGHIIQQGSSLSPIKFINKFIKFSQASIVTLQEIKAKFMTLLATVTTTIILTKNIGKILIGIEITVTTLTKNIGKIFIIIGSGIVVCMKSGGKLLKASSSTTTTIFKSIYKNLNISSITVLSYLKSIGSDKSIQQGSTLSPTKSIGKFLIFSQNSIVTLQEIKAKFMTLLVAVVTTVTLRKNIDKILNIVEVTSATFTKMIGKLFDIVESGITYCMKQGNKTLKATSNTSTLISKLIFKSIVGVCTSIVNRTKSIAKSLTSIQIITITSLTKEILKTLIAITATAVILAVNRTSVVFSKTIVVIQSSTVILSKFVYKNFIMISSIGVNFLKLCGKKLIIISPGAILINKQINKLLKFTDAAIVILTRIKTKLVSISLIVVTSIPRIPKFISKYISYNIITNTFTNQLRSLSQLLIITVTTSTFAIKSITKSAFNTIISTVVSIVVSIQIPNTFITYPFKMVGFIFQSGIRRVFGTNRSSPIDTDLDNNVNAVNRLSPIETDLDNEVQAVNRENPIDTEK